ncbi:ROK family protein [Dactylosporangium sp. NPDC049525]|uniref:ROK family protein n=1 Tax=Dactylosporangium sp. NPDC049525 TaxID=3154730 RepID=UPI003449D93B
MTDRTQVGNGGDVVVAVDVGGTTMKGALVDRSGTAHCSTRVPTDASSGPDAVLARLLSVVAALREDAVRLGLRTVAAGVAVPGIVDERNGVAGRSINLGWRDVPVQAILHDTLRLPTAVGQDVRAGALAEARLGAGRRVGSMVFVPIGTGIASATVVDGRVLTGARYAAGEIGHGTRATGSPCGCGSFGCLEQVASAAALARRYQERTGRTATSERLSADVAAGESDAVAVWRDAIEALADVLAITIAVVDPDTVVLGGGLSEAGETLLTPLRAAIRARLTADRTPSVVRAELGDQAGCLGAGLLAFELPSASRGTTT